MITPKYVIKKRKKNRIRKTIRKKLNGTPERPRLFIFKSNKYIYTQLIDDANCKVLASASTIEKEVSKELKSTKDTDAAKLLGKVIAERAGKVDVKTVVFDRNIYPFMGRVKAFADSVRENGIVL